MFNYRAQEVFSSAIGNILPTPSLLCLAINHPWPIFYWAIWDFRTQYFVDFFFPSRIPTSYIFTCIVWGFLYRVSGEGMNGLSVRLKARLLSEDPFIFQQSFPSLGVVFLLQVQVLTPCEEVRPRVNSRASLCLPSC